MSTVADVDCRAITRGTISDGVRPGSAHDMGGQPHQGGMGTQNMPRPQLLTYVLITPARNEEMFIGATIESVAAQTVLPRKWVIVSDGSTDRTDAIVRTQATRHPWIRFIRRPEHEERHFAAKVRCFNSGYETLAGETYDIIGNLDADITFEKDYFEFLLGKFAEDARLGVAGTPFVEGDVSYDYRFTNVEHVSGACQLLYKLGRQDYFLGGHPLWEFCRAAFQATRKPYVVGGLVLLAGYVRALVGAMERPVSAELVRFHRREQMQRLRHALSRARP
jgi:glycosyltransferase involved in cell wall biosynthesis